MAIVELDDDSVHPPAQQKATRLTEAFRKPRADAPAMRGLERRMRRGTLHALFKYNARRCLANVHRFRRPLVTSFLVVVALILFSALFGSTISWALARTMLAALETARPPLISPPRRERRPGV
jgi:hypothetical protein